VDRKAWVFYSLPALLAAATCPTVEVIEAPWISLMICLLALGTAHVAQSQGPILNGLCIAGLLMANATVLLLWPSNPLILAFSLTWITGLLSSVSPIRGVRSHAWNLVGGLGVALIAVRTIWEWARAKGLADGIEIATQFIAEIMRLGGADVSFDHNSLWLGTGGANGILVTPEALAWPYLLLWAVGVACMLLWNGQLPSIRFWSASLGFGCLALGVFLIKAKAVIDGYWPVEILPLTIWQFTWLVPIGVGLSHWIHRNDAKVPLINPVRSAALLTMLFVAGLTVYGLVMPYSSYYQSLRVLIDDGHGPWESTTVPVNTESYGRLTLYNYSLLRQWLAVHHSVEVTPTNSSIPKDLAEYQVLILKTPAKDYSSEEIEQVRSYVAQGGGLLLIGDHTNLFGHTQRLNQMAAPYGIAFRMDATFPWPDRDPPYIHQPSRSFGADRMLNGLGPFAVLTAASVTDRSLFGMPIMQSNAVISEAADYSNMNYFGPLRLSPDDRVAPTAMAIAKPYGNGKVVAWGESTMWSSFSLFHPEYPELILRLVGYLGTPSRHFEGQVTATISILILLGIGVWIVHRFGSLLMLQTVILSVPLGGLLGASVSFQADWPDVSQRIPSTVHSIAVDLQHSKTSLRIDPTRHRINEQDVYTAFYGWIGRIQVWPFPLKDWDTLSPTRPLLILNPVLHYTEKEITTIGNFVRTGGTLCVIDGGSYGESTAPEFLMQFGLQYRLRADADVLYLPKEGIEPWLAAGLALSPLMLGLEAMGEAQPAATPRYRTTSLQLSVAGGTPLAVTANGSVVWARKTYGQGKVLVFTKSHAFHQLSFGDIWGGTEPGAVRQQLYELEYDVIRELWASD
jgi:hypothetical protein